MERKASIKRTTRETDILVSLDIDCRDESVINSGVPFFDHMLASMSRHGRFFISLECKGDNIVDDHHSVEDIGICLGKAIRKALGDGAGIMRFGDAVIPMDDTLTLVALDLSGRSYYKYTGLPLEGYIREYSEDLTLEFLRALANNAGMNLHVNVFYGVNRHHIHESIFKALGVALFKACSIDETLGGGILSTKGIIV